jgi:nicotinamide/nicotinate riboside kinase
LLIQDPPRYWEEIVWPAYIASHQALFVGGDVQAGKIDTNVIEGVVIVEASGMSMDEMVNMACEVVYKKVKSS